MEKIRGYFDEPIDNNKKIEIPKEDLPTTGDVKAFDKEAEVPRKSKAEFKEFSKEINPLGRNHIWVMNKLKEEIKDLEHRIQKLVYEDNPKENGISIKSYQRQITRNTMWLLKIDDFFKNKAGEENFNNLKSSEN